MPTKYDTVVVAAEYDGFADFPDRVWNIVAVVNAYAGEILNHVPSVFTDLSTVSKSDITVTTNSLGGVTTAYFIPDATLPLVQLLPFLKPYEAQLKKIVDAGYVRHDPVSAAATPAAAAAVGVVSDGAPAAPLPTVAPAVAATAPAPAPGTRAATPRNVAPPSAAAAAPVLGTPADPTTRKQPVLGSTAHASVQTQPSKAHRGPGGSSANPAAAAVAPRARKSSG